MNTIKLFEVYDSNSLRCILFETKEKAMSQKMIIDVDFIDEVDINLSTADRARLKKDGFIDC